MKTPDNPSAHERIGGDDAIERISPERRQEILEQTKDWRTMPIEDLHKIQDEISGRSGSQGSEPHST